LRGARRAHIAAQLGASHPATGETFELNAIAAVVLGGTSLMVTSTIGGTLVGAFVIGILADGLVLLGVSEFRQMVIKGWDRPQFSSINFKKVNVMKHLCFSSSPRWQPRASSGGNAGAAGPSASRSSRPRTTTYL
jgi:hypothetical protein